MRRSNQAMDTRVRTSARARPVACRSKEGRVITHRLAASKLVRLRARRTAWPNAESRISLIASRVTSEQRRSDERAREGFAFESARIAPSPRGAAALPGPASVVDRDALDLARWWMDRDHAGTG